MRWHELEIAFAVARTGSTTDAARELGLSQPTVSRRLAALEAELGVRLFDRQAHRLVPTAAGTELVEAAEQIRGRVDDVVRRVEGRDSAAAGIVRVTGPRPVLRLLMPTFARIQGAHSELELVLLSSYAVANLNRSEADIALRITDRPAETLVGRRIARIAYGLYRRLDAAADDRRVVGFPPPRGDIAERPWLAAAVADPRVGLRIDEDELHHDAVRSGLGAAQLLCFVADADPDLERVPNAEVEYGSALWLLTHEAMRSCQRVRIVVEALTEALTELRPALEGLA